jgi:nucleotide-binding universal stress UspA family protein
MIETILIGVEDDSERMEPVLTHATEIAQSLSAHVVLYHAYDSETFESLLESRNLESADPTEMASQNATVEAAAATLRDAGVEFSIEGATGDPGDELTKYVETHDVDHVFVGGRDRSPTEKLLLGSVSQQVIIDVDVPCTIVR